MRKLFHRLQPKGSAAYFQKADIVESPRSLKNPGRGWYQIFPFRIGQEFSEKDLQYCLNAQESLVLLTLDIGEYARGELDAGALESIVKILNFFADAGKDVILRCGYDFVGKSMEKEPYTFHAVIRHMEQISQVLEANARKVFLYQGLLVGNWGEMHGSRYLRKEHLEQLAGLLSPYCAAGGFAAVRRPMYWRWLQEEQDLNSTRMGLFDDAILGTESDMGTFGTGTKDTAGWMQPWSREAELSFEERLCRNVPNGGEAVYGDGYWKTLSAEELLTQLRRMHITYLNRVHDAKLMEEWKKSASGRKGIWKDCSLYDYIGAHLGYRLVVRDVRVSRIPGRKLKVELEIENTGFANLYWVTQAALIHRDLQGMEKKYIPAYDLRCIESGSVCTIECETEDMPGALYLTANRKWDGKPIEFANNTDDSGKVLLGIIAGK